MEKFEDAQNGTDVSQRCQWIKGDGASCQAMVMEGDIYCFFHHPGKAGEREAAQRRGGEGNRAPVLPPDPSDFLLKSSQDVLEFLTTVINQVFRKEIGTKEATAIGYLVGIVQKALAARDFEERLAAVEAMIKTGQPNEGLFNPNGAGRDNP
jgi:hypothetical protein